MAFNITDRPQTVEEMRAHVSSAIVATDRARQSLLSNGPALAGMVSHIYSYMGLSDSEANLKGSEVLRAGQKIDAAIGEIMAALATVRRKTDEAIAAFSDHETKQRAARAKIG